MQHRRDRNCAACGFATAIHDRNGPQRRRQRPGTVQTLAMSAQNRMPDPPAHGNRPAITVNRLANAT